MIVIYALIDPVTGECRYIGKTKRASKRYIEHCQEHRNNARTHKAHWIKSLYPLTPEFVELERDMKDWQEAEQWWIAYFKSIGARLTNATTGGEGGRGIKHSQSTKDKLSAIMVGIPKSEATKAKMRANNSMKRPEIAAKNAEAKRGKPRPPEVREKLRIAQTGKKLSEETLAKMSAAHKNKPVSEHTRQLLRERALKRGFSEAFINARNEYYNRRNSNNGNFNREEK